MAVLDRKNPGGHGAATARGTTQASAGGLEGMTTKPGQTCCAYNEGGLDGCVRGCECQECQDLAHEESDYCDFLGRLPR